MIGRGFGWDTYEDGLETDGGVDVRMFTSFSEAITVIGSLTKTLLIPNIQTITANETVPSNITLSVPQSGRININTGIVLTLQGTIEAGNYQIFGGAGFTDTNQTPGKLNICWFPGSSFNDKWDSMINQWGTGYINRTVIVPRVPIGNPAAINTVTDKYAWKLDGSWEIDGPCNNLTVICEGRFFVEAASGVTNALVFTTSDKVEEVSFPRGVRIDCNGEATTGVLIQGGSRIYFGEMIRIHDCVNGVVINTTISTLSEIQIDRIYVGTYSGSAVLLNGNNTALMQITISDIFAEVTQSDSCRVLEIIGRVPNFIIGHVGGKKHVDLGTNEMQYGILLSANADGAPAYSRSNIFSAHFDFVGVAIKTEDLSGTAAVKISELDVGPIHAGNCTTLADLSYAKRCRFEFIDVDDPITIAADCEDLTIHTRKDIAALVTDNGVRTRINNCGHIIGSAATEPTTGNWEVGELVEVTADNKVYLKTSHTGVDAVDFIVLN